LALILIANIRYGLSFTVKVMKPLSYKSSEKVCPWRKLTAYYNMRG